MTDIPIGDYDRASDPTRYVAEDREQFRVTDDAQAAWAMRKLLAIRKKQQENAAVAQVERERIDEWLERVNAPFNDDASYFEGLLIRYAREQRDTEGRKTLDTPYGKVKSRSTQPRVSVENETEFLAWAEENLPDAVSVKITPSISVLKEKVSYEQTATLGWVAMLEHGEIVPGVSVEPSTVNYTVEVTP